MTKKATRSKVQRFEFGTMPRAQITEAPYNPRYQNDESAARLKEILENVGLVEPLVWNKQTSHLVGGHQRLRQMDAIQGDVDYDVPVAIIDVDEATEKQINVALNNLSIQGQWDFEKLGDLFQGTNPFEAGFDSLDLEQFFPHDDVLKMAEKFYPDLKLESLPGEPDPASVKDTADDIAAIKEARKQHKEADRESLRADHFFGVVFDTAAQAQHVANLLRLDPDQDFFFAPKFLSNVLQFGQEAVEYLKTVSMIPKDA